jgi:hypothetical protein
MAINNIFYANRTIIPIKFNYEQLFEGIRDVNLKDQLAVKQAQETFIARAREILPEYFDENTSPREGQTIPLSVEVLYLHQFQKGELRGFTKAVKDISQEVRNDLITRVGKEVYTGPPDNPQATVLLPGDKGYGSSKLTEKEIREGKTNNDGQLSNIERILLGLKQTGFIIRGALFGPQRVYDHSLNGLNATFGDKYNPPQKKEEPVISGCPK